jgi:uncharacterized membrane protein (UPF0127 family)
LNEPLKLEMRFRDSKKKTKIKKMSNKKTRIALYFLFSLLLFASVVCKRETDTPPIDTTKKIEKPSIPFVKQGEVYFHDKEKKMITAIDVEIAETDEKRHRGLMFRNKMEENQGMLFIFDNEEIQSFYMKNTLIPLDIIFINAKKQIVKIYKNTTPLSEKDLPSFKPCLYVVEVNGGYTDKYKIKEGDYIDWRRG